MGLTLRFAQSRPGGRSHRNARRLSEIFAASSSQSESTEERGVQLATTVLAPLSIFVLLAALTLGGGTRGGFLSDVILQLVSVPLLLLALWRISISGANYQLRNALIFCGILVSIPIFQLLPLPPALWSALPGRDVIEQSYVLIGTRLPWRPISVAPHATWLSLASLVVPLAIFLAVVQLPRRARRTLSLVLIGMGVVSVFLGLLQVAQGPESSLRFFAITNPTEAVGFFANRNHFAALLYTVTLIAVAWTVYSATLVASHRPDQQNDTPLILALIASLIVMLALVAAQMMARSRAGLALTIVVLIGAFALALRDRAGHGRLTSGRLLAATLALALLFGTQFALYRVLDRFASDSLSDARISLARTTFEAVLAHLPFGSGMGTFVPVYALFEKPQDAISAFANRAHNDILELWLEAGILPAVPMVLFGVWLFMRSVQLWRAKPQSGGEIDLMLARAASLVLVLLCTHSLVDYPLRTGAMMAVFALAAALTFDPPDAPDIPQKTAHKPAQRMTEKTRAASPSWAWPTPKPASQRRSQNNWPEIDWPEAWRTAKVPSPATPEKSATLWNLTEKNERK